MNLRARLLSAIAHLNETTCTLRVVGDTDRRLSLDGGFVADPTQWARLPLCDAYRDAFSLARRYTAAGLTVTVMVDEASTAAAALLHRAVLAHERAQWGAQRQQTAETR